MALQNSFSPHGDGNQVAQTDVTYIAYRFFFLFERRKNPKQTPPLSAELNMGLDFTTQDHDLSGKQEWDA